MELVLRPVQKRFVAEKQMNLVVTHLKWSSADEPASVMTH